MVHPYPAFVFSHGGSHQPATLPSGLTLPAQQVGNGQLGDSQGVLVETLGVSKTSWRFPAQRKYLTGGQGAGLLLRQGGTQRFLSLLLWARFFHSVQESIREDQNGNA